MIGYALGKRSLADLFLPAAFTDEIIASNSNHLPSLCRKVCYYPSLFSSDLGCLKYHHPDLPPFYGKMSVGFLTMELNHGINWILNILYSFYSSWLCLLFRLRNKVVEGMLVARWVFHAKPHPHNHHRQPRIPPARTSTVAWNSWIIKSPSFVFL